MNATIESALRLHLLQEGPCSLESLLARLSQYSWSEIFSVVDHLSREGRLVLRRPGRSTYEVSIEPSGASGEPAEGTGATGCRSHEARPSEK